MEITKDILYVGVNDRDIDLFEGQFEVPEGMAYNSYLIKDKKVAVADSVDARFTQQWLENISNALEGGSPDYLIVHHMEPDHSGSIRAFSEAYPEAVIVGNAKTFNMLSAFFPGFRPENTLTVAQGDSLCLGEHTLSFVMAPMVHWPEVMVSFDSKDKVLFSADAFGKFGALDADEDWACEARRYYFGIVGRFGAQVQPLLSKLKELPVEIICPLHGPVLKENLSYYTGLYNTWSSYEAESKGVFIAYTSVYGNTAGAVMLLKKLLEEKGCKVSVADLARDDMHEAFEDAFRYDRLVLATTTYNGDIFPFMKSFVDGLTERFYQNRTVGIIENGSWGPVAAKKIKKYMELSKNISWTQTTVTVRSALDEKSREQLEALAQELAD